MRTINFFVGIYILFLVTSCVLDEVTSEQTIYPRIHGTGDQGDDVGEPEGNLFILDSLNQNINATGDQGDDVGNPDD